MGRRLVKLGLIAAVVAGFVVIGKKLMGGLGPEPGSAAAPKEWPSLVPDPATPAPAPAASDNGSGSSSDVESGSGADEGSADVSTE